MYYSSDALDIPDIWLPDALLDGYGGPKQRPVDPFSTEAFVGPRGSAKSLIANHKGKHYADGKVKNEDGSCICGEPGCEEKWNVYSNLRSTNKGDPMAKDYGGGWTEPLDVAREMISHEAEHAVIIADEGYQMMDSRRGMSRNALEMIDEVTQGRKAKVKLMITGLSIDWIELRIRGQLTASYNCWTPNRGVTSYAVYTEHARGDLPPHIRAKKRSTIRWWHTERSRWIYNTNERVMSRGDVERKKQLGIIGERFYLRMTPDGVPEQVPISALMTDALAEALTGLGFDGRIEADAITAYCADLDAPVEEAEVENFLGHDLGFRKEPDGRYHIGMAMAGGVE